MRRSISGARFVTLVMAGGLLLLAACGGGGSGAVGLGGPVTPDPVGPDPVPNEPDPIDPNCPQGSFDGTFEAISKVVFEKRGCTTDACHGSGRAGELDLRAGQAYANLFDMPASAGDLLRIQPGSAIRSLLWRKLAAGVDPTRVTVIGEPMPSGQPAISENELEAIRLWIDAGAPEAGSIADKWSGGSGPIADLLDACLPAAEPVQVVPLDPPAPGEGVQLAMPPYPIPPASEHEVCFAVVFDFSDQVPAEYLDETGRYFYVREAEGRNDPNTHHMVLLDSRWPIERASDPSFGRWTCAGGANDGQTCDPLVKGACGDAMCRSELQDSVACIGFGPFGGGDATTPGDRMGGPDIHREGVYRKVPLRTLAYYNSHAFNITTEETIHHSWMNLYFADDRRFETIPFQDLSGLYDAAGTPAFQSATYCRDYTLAQGAQLVMLASHTHKRGERFWIDGPDGTRLYESWFYEDPEVRTFDPPMVFDSTDPRQRTLHYCALYNNGVLPAGGPDVDKVTRASRKPERSACYPTACAEGKVGAPCRGSIDHATCDTTPGAGDGMCDACPITSGITTDDEMFVLVGALLTDGS